MGGAEIEAEAGAGAAQERQRLRRLAEAVTARPGFTRSVGIELVSMARGDVVMAVPWREELAQVHGQFHGGLIATLADHAAGGAVTSALPPGRFAVTVDLHVTYLAPATGPRLTAHARAVQVGGTIGVAQVEVVAGEPGAERPCAVASATLRSVPLPDLPGV